MKMPTKALILKELTVMTEGDKVFRKTVRKFAEDYGIGQGSMSELLSDLLGNPCRETSGKPNNTSRALIRWVNRHGEDTPLNKSGRWVVIDDVRKLINETQLSNDVDDQMKEHLYADEDWVE